MICNPCRDAADRRAPRDQHCDDAGCTCGHRVERYRETTGRNDTTRGEIMPKLNVTFIPELRRVSVCESGRHEHHIGQTCAEVDAEPSIETLLGEALKGVWPAYGVMTEQEAEDAFPKRLHDYLEDNRRRNRIGPYSVSRLIEEFEDGRQVVQDTDPATED